MGGSGVNSASQEKRCKGMTIDFDGSMNVFTDASVTTVNGKNVSCPGYIIVRSNQIVEANFRIIYDSTNNYGEIYALYMGINAGIELAYKTGYTNRINIFSDSQISVYGLRDWIFAWYRKTDKNHMMISSNKVPISNQFVYKRIVKTINCSKLPIHIYHQLSHMTNSSKSVKKVMDTFKRVNKEDLDEEIAAKIISYNNFIDRFTRNNLLSISGMPVFDGDKCEKDVENNDEILTEEDLVAYGTLINKMRNGSRHSDDTDISLQQDETIIYEEYENDCISDSDAFFPIQSNPDTAESMPKSATFDFSTEAEQNTVSLAVGDMIHHRKFGEGVVIAIQEGKQFEAVFDTVGTKALIWEVFDRGIVQKAIEQ